MRSYANTTMTKQAVPTSRGVRMYPAPCDGQFHPAHTLTIFLCVFLYAYVRLYVACLPLKRDGMGYLKGDGSVCYVKSESVDMAINVLHEGQIRPGVTIEVCCVVRRFLPQYWSTAAWLVPHERQCSTRRPRIIVFVLLVLFSRSVVQSFRIA